MGIRDAGLVDGLVDQVDVTIRAAAESRTIFGPAFWTVHIRREVRRSGRDSRLRDPD
jgi:hypothetical protein